MRQLRVDLSELEAAFDNSSYESRYFLDLETGELQYIDESTVGDLDSLDVEPDEEDEPGRTDADMRAAEDKLPRWQREAMEVAREVAKGYGTRYIEVPRVGSHEAYRDMEKFIATVRDARLQDRLYRAIGGRGAFRYFRDVLYEHPSEQKRWYAFKDECMRRRVLDWLEQEEIEPIGE
jgi:hypothetical protein